MEEINIFDYLRIIRKQWRSVAAVTVVAVVTAMLYVKIAPTKYEATTTLILQQQSPTGGLLAQLSGFQSLLSSPSQVSASTYTQILKSRKLREAVVKNLGIDHLKIPVKELKNGLDVTTPKDGGIVITCTTSSSWFKNLGKDEARKRAARLAADMANAYVAELQIYDQSSSLATGRKNRIFIEGELDKTRTRLTRAENEFARFRKENPSIFPVEQAAEEVKSFVDLRAKQLVARAEREEIGKRLESAISALSREDRTVLASEILSDNPAMTRLRERLAELEVRRATLLENLTEKHPDVVSLDQEIEKTREKMAGDIRERITSSQTLNLNPVYQELQGQIIALEVDRVGLEAREQAFGTVIESFESRISQTTDKQLQFIRLMRDVKALETVYATLLGEYSKAQINEARESDGFQVLDTAEVPKGPSSPKIMLTLAAALVCGLILGTFLAFIQGSATPKNRKLIETPKAEMAGTAERQ